jgi:hypothetical protein
MKIGVLSVSLALACGAALAGQIGRPISAEDFGPGALLTTFDDLSLSFRNPAPLVLDGNTFTTESGTFRYGTSADFGSYLDCNRECIGNETELGYIDVALGSTASRIGASVGGKGPFTGRVEFFGAGDALLGTVKFAGNESRLVFVGWENLGAAGITRARFHDTAKNGSILGLDDLRFESPVPEPGSFAMFAAGLAALALCASSPRRVGRRQPLHVQGRPGVIRR